MHDNLDIEVFRAGDYGAKGRWGEAELDGLAGDYDPALHEAPVTLDHAQSGPALGWVGALRRVGDRLVALLRGVSDRLLDLLRTGAFKKRSVEIYPALRETGRPYLRAVSFLGAAVPEVKGLADPPAPGDPGASSEPGDSAEPAAPNDSAILNDPVLAPLFNDASAEPLHFDDDEPPAIDSSTPAIEPSASSTPHPAAPEPPASEPPQPSPLAFDELTARLRQAGKWHPAWASRGIVDFYQTLCDAQTPCCTAVIAFSEDRRLAPADWFAAFLESLPPVVAMGELAPAPDPAGCGIPDAPNVDPASIELHRAALALRGANPALSYSAALARCAK